MKFSVSQKITYKREKDPELLWYVLADISKLVYSGFKTELQKGKEEC